MDNIKKIIKRKYIAIITLVISLAIVTGGMIYFYYQYDVLKNNPDAIVKKESQELVKKLSELMELPKDEQPSIATVMDKNKLKDQLFFSKAENNDKVFIFSKAGQAILYRPSTNKIIAVVPITLQGNQINSPTELIEKPVRVAVYNGGNKSGLAEAMKINLIKNISNLEITTGNANKHDYQETIVIKLSTNMDATAVDKISLVSNGQISTLPEGEIKPDADILVIVSGQ